jgi:hypothetical protein
MLESSDAITLGLRKTEQHSELGRWNARILGEAGAFSLPSFQAV